MSGQTRHNRQCRGIPETRLSSLLQTGGEPAVSPPRCVPLLSPDVSSHGHIRCTSFRPEKGSRPPLLLHHPLAVLSHARRTGQCHAATHTESHGASRVQTTTPWSRPSLLLQHRTRHLSSSSQASVEYVGYKYRGGPFALLLHTAQREQRGHVTTKRRIPCSRNMEIYVKH